MYTKICAHINKWTQPPCLDERSSRSIPRLSATRLSAVACVTTCLTQKTTLQDADYTGSARPHFVPGVPREQGRDPGAHLKEVGELGVAVGHVLALANQALDAVAEGRQRFVDVLSLLEAIPLRPRLA